MNMKKPISINNIINNKEYEKLNKEFRKLREEFNKYKESTSDKLKEIEILRKENDDLRKKFNKITINTYQPNVNQMKYNLDNYISLLEKQKEFLIAILLTLFNNLNIKNKINKDMILFQLEKNIGKEKEKEKFLNDIINLIQENKNYNNYNYNINNNNKIINLRYRNTNYKYNYNLCIYNFKFQFLAEKVNKVLFKNNKINNYIYISGNDKLRDKKETDLLKKINEMLNIIKKKKDLLKLKKNNLSFRTSTIKEEN